jgi:hypothetical protein
MGLTELPSELFRMKNVKELALVGNNLCSLPSEIVHLTKLEGLSVRVRELSGLIVIEPKVTLCAGRLQPAHVSSARALSADQSHEALCAGKVAEGS